MGRIRSYSNNKKNIALGMMQSGLSCRNVADMFGVSPSTISSVW